MNLKINLFVVALIAILFPLLLNPILDFTKWLGAGIFTEKGLATLQYFVIDKSTYLTILSIEATTLVAFSIYWMQMRAEKLKQQQQKEQARNALFSTLVASLKEIHILARVDLYKEQNYQFIHISEKHFEAISEIPGLSDEEIRLLHFILKELECLVEHEKEDEVGDIRLHVEKLISRVFIAPYVLYRYEVSEPKDVFEVMHEQLLSILRRFDYAKENVGKRKYLDENNSVMMEIDIDEKIIVRNRENKQICHAFIDENGIREGSAKLYEEGQLLFDGEWKNYKKHGTGTAYFEDFIDALLISKEGEWRNNQLWNGIIYDVLVNSDCTLIDDDFIQISKEFRWHEATWLSDFTSYGVMNISIKEGQPSLETNTPIREVKAAYEAKYGPVEWPDKYVNEVADDLPNIMIEINGTTELHLPFNDTLHIEFLSIPEEIQEIPSHLEKYVENGELDIYNVSIPKQKEAIIKFNDQIKTFEMAQMFGVELDISIINKGTQKANGIYIDLAFPKDLLILKGTKEDLEYPDIPILPTSPLDKAWGQSIGNTNLTSLLSSTNQLINYSSFKQDRSLLQSLIPVNPNYWTKLEQNTIQLYCAELMHTRQQTFRSKFLLVPMQKGHFEIEVSIVCEEYRKLQNATFHVNVFNE